MSVCETKLLAELELKSAILAARVDTVRLHARASAASLAAIAEPEALRRRREELASHHARLAWLETLVALTDMRLALPQGAPLEQRLVLALHALLDRRAAVLS